MAAASSAAPPLTVVDMLGGLSVCDDCQPKSGVVDQEEPLNTTVPMTPGKMKAQQQEQKAKQQIVLHEDEDGYCELVEIAGRDRRRRSSSINKNDAESAVAASAAAVQNGGGVVDVAGEDSVAGAGMEDVEAMDLEEQQRLLSGGGGGSGEGGGDSYYKSAMKLKEQLLSSTQTVPLNLIAANVLALNQTITKLLVSVGATGW